MTIRSILQKLEFGLEERIRKIVGKADPEISGNAWVWNKVLLFACDYKTQTTRVNTADAVDINFSQNPK